MMGWGNEMGWAMWLLMAVGTVGFWVLVVVVARTLIFSGPGRQTTPQDAAAMTALNILDQRLARGEIGVEEYASRRRTITEGR